MAVDQIFHYLNQYTPVSPRTWRAIAPHWELLKIAPGDLLLREGQICQYLYFLEEGLLRFYVLRDGWERNKFFTEAPYCFTSQKSFTQQVPAEEQIAAIEASKLFRMRRDIAFSLLENKSWNTFIRKLIQEVQLATEDILEALQNETAEDRYRQMLIDQPELVQRLPLKQLASYLGIAPQSLSRIRKKLTQQDKS